MRLLHLFAHNGVEHATSAEAAAHGGSDKTLVIALVSVVTIIVLVIALKLLNRSKKTPTKEEANDD